MVWKYLKYLGLSLNTSSNATYYSCIMLYLVMSFDPDAVCISMRIHPSEHERCFLPGPKWLRHHRYQLHNCDADSTTTNSASASPSTPPKYIQLHTAPLWNPDCLSYINTFIYFLSFLLVKNGKKCPVSISTMDSTGFHRIFSMTALTPGSPVLSARPQGASTNLSGCR